MTDWNDPAARTALQAFALACENDRPALAEAVRDLAVWADYVAYGHKPDEAGTTKEDR